MQLYSALDRPKEQIRLLSFAPNTSNKVSLRLETFDLKKCPAFTALSYVWGPPGHERSILLNGQQFDVRPNLHSALKALRARSQGHGPLGPSQAKQKVAPSEPYFWTDALCINQANGDERMHQVGLMGEVYTKASSVLVWLGTECEAALEPLTKRRDAISVGENYNVEQQMKKRGKEEEHTAARKQMEAVFRSAYWQRLWTVQEFELAKTIVFGAGQHFVTYDRLIKHLQNLKFLDKDDPVMIDGTGDSAKPRFYPMLSRITTRKVMIGKPLWRLAMRYGDSQCSEPLDLIYRLLGLTAKTTLEAKYEQSPAELCHILPEYGVDKDKIPLALRKAAGL